MSDTPKRCYCGALKDEPHLHTGGFAWRELFALLRDRATVMQRTLAAWNETGYDA